MNSNPKLTYAIAAILSGSGMGMGISQAATTTEASDSEAIPEIVVTAQRREESIQNVPITIQAITGEQLKQLNVATFDDVAEVPAERDVRHERPGLRATSSCAA